MFDTRERERDFDKSYRPAPQIFLKYNRVMEAIIVAMESWGRGELHKTKSSAWLWVSATCVEASKETSANIYNRLCT